MAGFAVLSRLQFDAHVRVIDVLPEFTMDQVAEACAEVERRERPLLEICRGDAFDLERYIALRVASQEKTEPSKVS